MNTKDIAKVLLTAGWIPVDENTFKVIDFDLQDDLQDKGPRTRELNRAVVSGNGFTFESDGQVILGPLHAIQAVKVK